ncbi:hypothetical protein PH547_32325 [Rhizobium sp. CNPSo 3464]|uniref:hypothetical protein n=1 Tax=Rhizobium sp. CNPSo 3464 TaxID=3021406 RepID=UPI00254EA875|nr:hypothetical protein [Rhizobium sp. CNPSo 3464]MDK4743554.1 hypothetical protein [Rhizobium sp. CNPSo 3464]
MNLTATGDIASQTTLSAGDFTAQAADLQADSIFEPKEQGGRSGREIPEAWCDY